MGIWVFNPIKIYSGKITLLIFGLTKDTPKMKINWVKIVKQKERAQKTSFRYIKHGISLYPFNFVIVFVI